MSINSSMDTSLSRAYALSIRMEQYGHPATQDGAIDYLIFIASVMRTSLTICLGLMLDKKPVAPRHSNRVSQT